jgi:hypothetical protein
MSQVFQGIAVEVQMQGLWWNRGQIEGLLRRRNDAGY